MPEPSAELLRRAAETVRGNDPSIHVVARAEFKDGDEQLGELIAALLEDAADNVEMLAPDGPLGPNHNHIMVSIATSYAMDLARAILGEPA